VISFLFIELYVPNILPSILFVFYMERLGRPKYVGMIRKFESDNMFFCG